MAANGCRVQRASGIPPISLSAGGRKTAANSENQMALEAWTKTRSGDDSVWKSCLRMLMISGLALPGQVSGNVVCKLVTRVHGGTWRTYAIRPYGREVMWLGLTFYGAMEAISIRLRADFEEVASPVPDIAHMRVCIAQNKTHSPLPGGSLCDGRYRCRGVLHTPATSMTEWGFAARVITMSDASNGMAQVRGPEFL